MILAPATALLLALAPASAPIPEAQAEDVHSALVGAKATVIDARSVQEYEQGHIPGALSIPADRTKAEAARLPKDRAAPIIFYCRGPG